MKRHLAFACALIGAFVIPAIAQEDAPNEGRAQPGPKMVIARNLEFARAGGQALQLDLYRQDPTPKPSPVVVWIHGDDTEFTTRFPTPAGALVSPGFAVASIDLRTGPGSTLTTQVRAREAARRW